MPKKQSHKRKQLGNKEKNALHLVEFNQGRPNEISLDVLSKKAASYDEKKPSVFGRLFDRDLGSADGVPDTPIVGAETKDSAPVDMRAKKPHKAKKTAAEQGKFARASKEKRPASTPLMGADSQREVERRQRIRRNSKIVSAIVVVLILVVLVAIGGQYLYGQYLDKMSNVQLLEESCRSIEASDPTIVEIDQFFREPFGDDTVTKAQALMDKIPAAKQQLEEANMYATRANEGLSGNSQEKQAAEAALESIKGRQALLSVSEEKLNNDIAAKQAYDKLSEVDKLVSDATSLLSQAAKLVSSTTEENTNSSTQFTTEAQQKLKQASQVLAEVHALYPTADVSVIQSYIDKRQESINAALASNAAILLQDKQTAESYNDAYNKADAEAVEIAKSMPKEFNQPLIDAYTIVSNELDERYSAARSTIAANDSVLRDFLGSKNKGLFQL